MSFALQIVVTLAAVLFTSFAAGFIMAFTRPQPLDKLCIARTVEAAAIVTVGVGVGLPPGVIVGWTLAVGVHLAIDLRRLTS